TPEAPANDAVLEQHDTAAALIRQKNELADARKALDAQRAKWIQEQAEHKARVEAMERAFQDFERDPVAFAKARAGKRSLVDLARELYIADAELDKLPPEQAMQIRAERELHDLRRQQARMQSKLQAKQAEHRVAMYRSQLATGLAQLGDATPLVKTLAASDPQLVLQQLEAMAGELAVKRPELGAQTAAQLAIMLEPQLQHQLEETSKRFKTFFEKRFPGASPASAAAAAVIPASPPVIAKPSLAAEPTLSRDLTPTTP